MLSIPSDDFQVSQMCLTSLLDEIFSGRDDKKISDGGPDSERQMTARNVRVRGSHLRSVPRPGQCLAIA